MLLCPQNILLLRPRPANSPSRGRTLPSTWIAAGLEGSLSLVAEILLPPKWLGSSKLASAITKQTIRLPTGGTLSNSFGRDSKGSPSAALPFGSRLKRWRFPCIDDGPKRRDVLGCGAATSANHADAGFQ